MSPGADTLTIDEARERAESVLHDLPAAVSQRHGRVLVRIEPASLQEAGRRLRDDDVLALKMLSMVGGVDYEDRVETVYILRSVTQPVVFELRVPLPRDGAKVPTVSNIWSTANWHEREAYDMFGIDFEGHPDQRRLLTREDFEGHPLRKDARPRRVERDEWSFGTTPAKRLPGERDRSERS